MAYVPNIQWYAIQPWSAPYFVRPAPQPPAVRSVALPPQVIPQPTAVSRYKTAVAPAFLPGAMASVRQGSGVKSL